METVTFIFFLLLGMGLALIGMLLLVLVGLPALATTGLFVNKPNGLEKSGIHFFTNLSPGQVKFIVRGKRLVRANMSTAGKRFKRIGERDHPDYWDIVDGESEDPTSDIYWLFRPWAKLVYITTGLVFTGIYPIQRVYEYELERTVVDREERDEKDSNLVLTVKRDVSDHFRTRQFNYPMHITKAESNDKIPLDIVGVAEMETVNPHRAAFGTDRWDQTVLNLVSDAITSETKQMTLDQALTAKNKEEARRINTAVENIKDDTTGCGIQILAFRILEINPALDEDGLRTLQAEAIATQAAKATRIDGDARADAQRSLNKANAEGGEHARATLEAEALVRAAAAASKGGGTVILTPQGGNGGGATDPIQAAILAELKSMNKSNNPNGGN